MIMEIHLNKNDNNQISDDGGLIENCKNQID